MEALRVVTQVKMVEKNHYTGNIVMIAEGNEKKLTFQLTEVDTHSRYRLSVFNEDYSFLLENGKDVFGKYTADQIALLYLIQEEIASIISTMRETDEENGSGVKIIEHILDDFLKEYILTIVSPEKKDDHASWLKWLGVI